MATNSKIEWTEATWNPVTGCSKTSPGCAHCYAERMALRLRAMGQPNYRRGFRVAIHPAALALPLSWKKPQMIFVNSMGDLFHDKVSVAYIRRVFSVMSQAHWHQFQVLTKRAARLEELNNILDWPENVWMGVSVENRDTVYRISHLRRTDAAVKFVSFEPLLGPVGKCDLRSIDWAIVGGESGPHARMMTLEWAVEIRNQCVKYQVPFFFKQWGGTRKKLNGRLLEGREWDEMPAQRAG